LQFVAPDGISSMPFAQGNPTSDDDPGLGVPMSVVCL
jgi:hypothetical protein